MTKAAELAKMGEVLTNSQIGGRRNIVINGAMQVGQRGTTTGMGDSNKYGACDRFVITSSGTNGRLTSTQDTDAPAGFTTAYKLDCTTAVADADIASAALTRIRYRIEGQDIQQLQKGTSTAKKLTLTYYAKANVAGVYIIEAQDNGNNRIASVAHSITTSYQKFTHTFPADTTGTIANDTNTGFTISWYLHVGSDYKGGALSSTFITGDVANKGVGQTGNVFKTTDSTFFLTGVQLELGEQATPFEYRSFGEELTLCQRYYYERMGAGTALAVSGGEYQYVMSGIAYNTTLGIGGLSFPNSMRTTPALGVSNVAHFIKQTAGRGDNVTAINLYDSAIRATNHTAYIQFNSSTSTAGGAIMTSQNASARLNFDAEL